MERRLRVTDEWAYKGFDKKQEVLLMNMKKLTALFCAFAMTFSLTACGGAKETSDAAAVPESSKAAEGTADGGADTGESQASGDAITFPLAETKEYSVFAILNQEYDLQDNISMQTVTEAANLKFNFQSVMGADLKEKRNLVLASGEYPDMFFKAGFEANDLEKYGKQGLFLPLEDMIKQYAPNLSARLDEMDGWDYLTSSDGHIYSLPGIERQNGAMTTYWINKRWMDNLGLQEPKSLDELYEVLKAFKEEDANGNGDPNDEIPLTATDVVKPDLLLAYFGIPYDYGTKTAVIDGELTYIPTSETFKKYVAYVAKLYQEGLLDKNAFTQKHEQQGAIGQSGDVLGSFFDAGAFLTVGRDNDDDYIALTPFEDGLYPLGTGIFPGTMVLTDTCKDPEVLIAWADQFYTEEGGILTWLGIEGKTWQMDEDGNWEWIVGQGYGDDIATVRSSSTIQGAAYHPSIQSDFWFDKMSEKVDPDEVYLNGEKAKVAAKGAVPLPMMRYSDGDAKTISTIKPDIDAYIDQYVAQVATGELNLEDSWDEYVATVGNMGGGQLEEIYKNTYKEAIGK